MVDFGDNSLNKFEKLGTLSNRFESFGKRGPEKETVFVFVLNESSGS